jgi:hypothetical protein
MQFSLINNSGVLDMDDVNNATADEFIFILCTILTSKVSLGRKWNG